MRTKIIVSLFIITVIAVSQFIKPLKNFSHTNETNTLTDSLPFIVGAYANANENNVDLLKDSLGMNMWHTFLNQTVYATIGTKNYYRPLGWSTTDTLFFPNNQSNPAVTNILDRNEDKLRTLMSRPKTEWLFFAQRSDYQCEEESFLSNHDYNWFYTYNEHPRGRNVLDDSPYGQGARVRYCGTRDPDLKGMPMDSGYAVKGLKANREQVNTGNPGHGYPYPGFGDGQFSWYVKPRIRIDSTFAANPVNYETKVCRIEVYNYEGVKIKSRDIKIKNFIDRISLVYHGNYLETFFDRDNDTANTVILNGWDFNPNDKEWVRYSKDICNVDFRVFWYGKCDMWIDYVRVEDQRAYDLFGDIVTNPTTQLYQAMIQSEVTNAQYTTSPLLFYIDEFEFNHIPAISFVMKKIQSYAGSQNVPFALATNSPNDFYNNHLSSGWLNSDHFKRYLLDSCKVKLYCKSNSYPFTGRRDANSQFISYIPNTLPITSSPYNSAQVKNPNAYEEWLQNWIKSYYKWDCQELQNLSKMKPEMNTCFSIQTHAHFAEDSLREPTNEEIKMNVNMALSYGFKGIIYYDYDAFGRIGIRPWSVALLENQNNTLLPRRINFYGQKKWDEVKKINSTVNKWAPYIQSFDVGMTKTYIYDTLSERQDLSYYTYISELRSYQPDNSISQSPSNIYDDPNQTYSQVSVFNNSASADNFTNYFMVVNRRCSPYRKDFDIPGGLRYMKIKLHNNINTFNNFNNWIIKDIRNDSIIKVFDKNTLDFIDLGWYEPAEGRIYKLAPVMVEGGTFVCDELVTATTFNCNGTVNTGGYNLNIPATNGMTTISFSQNGTIVGNNGTDFIIRGYNQIILQGQNGNKWKGLTINNCANINIHNTKFKDIGDVNSSSYWALSLYDCPSVEISSCNFELPPQAKGININNFSAEETAGAIMNNNISVSNSTAAIFVGCSSYGYRHLFLMDNVITNSGA